VTGDVIPEALKRVGAVERHAAVLREVVSFVQQQPLFFGTIRKEGNEIVSDLEATLDRMKEAAVQMVPNEEDVRELQEDLARIAEELIQLANQL
jgi:uncharacterized protein Yka (UPF0111/DUF47 family)